MIGLRRGAVFFFAAFFFGAAFPVVLRVFFMERC
jgi:VIT1/CCC1 family predicted Fe2+/Mn2+ transporter